MRLLTLTLISSIILFSCNNKSKSEGKSEQSTIIPTVNYAELKPRLHHNNDTLYVVNFWASWCNPCVKEIPDFEKVNAEFKDKKVKFLMVSLDFPKQLEPKVIPFVKEQNMKAEVVLLFDPKANTWINDVSTDWTGSIPATLIYKKDFRSFHEGSYTYDELKHIVELNLTK